MSRLRWILWASEHNNIQNKERFWRNTRNYYHQQICSFLFYTLYSLVHIFRSSLPGLAVPLFMFSIELQTTEVFRFWMCGVWVHICLCLFSQTIVKRCLLFQVHVRIRAAKGTGLYKNESTGISLGWYIRAVLSLEQTYTQYWKAE